MELAGLPFQQPPNHFLNLFFLIFFRFEFQLFKIFIYLFIFIQLQLSAFSPLPSTPPQPVTPPSPTSNLHLDFVLVSFIVALNHFLISNQGHQGLQLNIEARPALAGVAQVFGVSF